MAVTTSPIQYARSSDDVHIAYQVLGSGSIDAVLLPGFVNHLEVVLEFPETRQWIERLASFCRLITFDRRGQGLSDRPAVFTIEDHARDVVAVLDAAGSERAALIGISEGGPASIMAAATHPDRISSLVLIGTWARICEASDYPIGAEPWRLEGLRKLLVEHWGEPVGLPLFVGEQAAAEPRFQAFWGRLLRSGTSPAGVNRLVDMWHEFDVRPLLPAVRQRALVMSRSDDPLAAPPFGRYIAERMPSARYVEQPGPHHPAAGDIEAMAAEVEEFLTGERHRPAVDRALATVMFTDIVGSTEQAAALGDARWGALLGEHDRIVRAELDRFGGREIKHLGDGFFAAFDGPARAIRCASSITDAVRLVGVDVRAGIHTGECEVRGDDLAGMAVHIGARVAASAGPSEVLVSGTVRDLVVGSGLPLSDRGVHELKGVEGEWRLFALDRR